MKFLFSIFAVLLICACNEASQVPADVYAPEKMERIYWDMLLADRYAAIELVKDSARIDVKKETFKQYAKVFAIHKTDQAEFTRSFQYYLSRPDLTAVMFDSLYARAGRQRAENYQRYR